MVMLQAQSVRKRFLIPDVHRQTVREHVFDFFRRRHFHPFHAVDGVSLAVPAGASFGIMGRNGCGKSTLLKMLAGIYQPDSGTVTAHGAITPILELGVGWNPELDAIDNILLVGSVMGVGLRDLREMTPGILAFAELEEFAALKLQHYSSGMAARLAYAIAFAAVRDILVLDEIFAVGDAGFRSKCEARFRELHAAGCTIVMVSHDPETVTRFCDHAVLMDAGRIVLEGSPQAVADEYLARLGAPAMDGTRIASADGRH